jgi:predicted nucleic acid-binding protein
MGKIFRIDLLTRLCAELVVPSGVAEEIRRGSEDDAAKQWLSGEGAGKICEPAPVDPRVGSWDMGLGESHVLSWALRHPGYEAIVDDGAARKCSVSLGIPTRGTLGVVLLAEKEGLVTSARAVLEELLQNGYRIDEALVEEALTLTRE